MRSTTTTMMTRTLHGSSSLHQQPVQLMPKPSLSQIREGNFVYSLINFADVRTGVGGYGLMWTKADRVEGGSIFAIFLQMSFMDDPLFDGKFDSGHIL